MAPEASLELAAGVARSATAPRGRSAGALRRLLADGAAIVGLALIVLLALTAGLAPVLAPFDPTAVSLARAYQGPDPEHWLGTDEVGRDILSRLLYGARLSLATGLIAVAVALALGVPVGLVAGYGGPTADLLLMGVMDVMLAFPALLLAILIVTILGAGAESAMLAVGLSSVPIFARLVRASTLTIRQSDYVSAARALGVSAPVLVLRHVLPNALSPLLVQSTLRIATAILTAAGLGFLGLGAQPPAAEWGLMLNQGRAYLQTAPHIVLFPSLAIMLAVLAFNLFGDGLNDALNPRLR
ncbi:MAG TPA: ABC transporter permease [Methylomirabilota bacterium]|jgi:peptide/nickel transport system permease protein|nr:ABC transporter permease [Methylomirabilota bacterium]